MSWFDADDAPDRRDLETCIHCGLCLTACPTYRTLRIEPDSPRGRLYLMRGLAEGRIEPDADVVRHLDQCLDCRACETVCPAGVPYGTDASWMPPGCPAIVLGPGSIDSTHSVDENIDARQVVACAEIHRRIMLRNWLATAP